MRANLVMRQSQTISTRTRENDDDRPKPAAVFPDVKVGAPFNSAQSAEQAHIALVM
jgi:hypothetical protein